MVILGDGAGVWGDCGGRPAVAGSGPSRRRGCQPGGWPRSAWGPVPSSSPDCQATMIAPMRSRARRALFSSGPASTDGTWPSLVGHLTGGQGVAGSNPAVPTEYEQIRGHFTSFCEVASRSFDRSLTAGFRGILCSTRVGDVTRRQRCGEHSASRDGAWQARGRITQVGRIPRCWPGRCRSHPAR